MWSPCGSYNRDPTHLFVFLHQPSYVPYYNLSLTTIQLNVLQPNFTSGIGDCPGGVTPGVNPRGRDTTDTVLPTRIEACDGTIRVWLHVQKHGRSDASPSPASRSGRGQITACGDCTPCGFPRGICKARRGTRKPRSVTPRHFTLH